MYVYIYIYIHNLLDNTQPITRPNSPPAIGQYNLYFLYETLYWTDFGKRSYIGYIGQFWNDAAGTHHTRPADRPLANASRWSKWSANCQKFRKTGEDDKWHWNCLVSFIQWRVNKILFALPSNLEYTGLRKAILDLASASRKLALT